MTKYKLKKGQENFTPMSGSFEGKKFKRGETYGEIPPEERRRFEKIPDPKSSPGGQGKSAPDQDKKTKAANSGAGGGDA